MRESLYKKVIFRMLSSFASTVAVTEIVMLINTAVVIRVTGNPNAIPLVPAYAAHFSNDYIALIVQVLLCGLIGMSFGGCSVIMEFEKWSMVKQGILHFVLTAIVWIPVSIFCWGLGKYTSTFISVCISLCVTYATVWISKILYYRSETKKINQRLLDMQKEQRSFLDTEGIGGF